MSFQVGLLLWSGIRSSSRNETKKRIYCLAEQNRKHGGKIIFNCSWVNIFFLYAGNQLIVLIFCSNNFSWNQMIHSKLQKKIILHQTKRSFILKQLTSKKYLNKHKRGCVFTLHLVLYCCVGVIVSVCVCVCVCVSYISYTEVSDHISQHWDDTNTPLINLPAVCVIESQGEVDCVFQYILQLKLTSTHTHTQVYH